MELALIGAKQAAENSIIIGTLCENEQIFCTETYRDIV